MAWRRLTNRKTRLAILTGIALSAAAAAWVAAPALGGSVGETAANADPAAKTRPYSPPLREPGENNLYWGDLHLHTAN